MFYNAKKEEVIHIGSILIFLVISWLFIKKKDFILREFRILWMGMMYQFLILVWYYLGKIGMIWQHD